MDIKGVKSTRFVKDLESVGTTIWGGRKRRKKRKSTEDVSGQEKGKNRNKGRDKGRGDGVEGKIMTGVRDEKSSEWE